MVEISAIELGIPGPAGVGITAAEKAALAPKASPTFTGTVTIPTATITTANVTTFAASGNATVAGTLAVDGNTTFGNSSATDRVTINGPLKFAGSAPTISTAGANIGTTGTAILDFGADARGVVKVTPGGTGITSGVLFTISFLQTKQDANYVVILTAEDSDAAGLLLYVNETTQTVNSVSIRTTSTPVSGTEYRVGYIIFD